MQLDDDHRPRADRRRDGRDRALLCSALRVHGRHAAERLAVEAAWMREDAAEAVRAGAATRAAMRTARAERLERVVARLRRGERGA